MCKRFDPGICTIHRDLAILSAGPLHTTYAHALSRQATLSSGESSLGKVSTSSRPCGKAPIGWHTSPGLAQYASRQRMAYQSRPRGTLRIYASSTHDHRHARQFFVSQWKHTASPPSFTKASSRGSPPQSSLHIA